MLKGTGHGYSAEICRKRLERGNDLKSSKLITLTLGENGTQSLTEYASGHTVKTQTFQMLVTLKVELGRPLIKAQ